MFATAVTSPILGAKTPKVTEIEKKFSDPNFANLVPFMRLHGQCFYKIGFHRTVELNERSIKRSRRSLAFLPARWNTGQVLVLSPVRGLGTSYIPPAEILIKSACESAVSSAQERSRTSSCNRFTGRPGYFSV